MNGGRSSGWRTAFAVQTVVALVAIAYLLFAVLDRSVTVTHRDDEATRVEASLRLLGELVSHLAPGRTKADVLALIRRARPDAFIVATDSPISIDNLTFRFDGTQRLVSVKRD